MKRATLVLLAVLILTAGAAAETADLSGEWLMTKAVMTGKTENVYQTLNFRDDGYAEMQGRVFGTWVEDTQNRSVTIKSAMINEFQGTWKISSPSPGELMLESDTGKLYFIPYDIKKITQENSESELQGVWKLDTKNDEGADVYVYFKLPNMVTIKDIGEGFTGSTGGIWIYGSKDKSIILSVRDQLLKGKHTVLKIDEHKLVLGNAGSTIKAEKIRQTAKNREKLDFTESGNGNGKSLDPDTFPWFDIYRRIDSLQKVKELTYKKSTLLPDLDIYITKSITADVSASEDTGKIHISHIFGTLYADNYYEDNVFYPVEEPDTYTAAGEREITVPAGTFLCRIINIYDDFDERKTRLYMIENRPGIYARIINIQKDFGNETYTIYELAGIK